MEENNQNESNQQSGYTGEYGNSVEGAPQPQQEPQEESTYSYSYRNNPDQATRSGDYHAEQNTSEQTAGQNESQGQYDNGQSTSGSQQSGTGYQQTGTGEQQSGNQGQYNNWQTGSGYQQPGGQFYGGSGQTSQKKPKKPDSTKKMTGKKIALCVVCAILFGVIAGACFEGVHYFTKEVLNIDTTGASANIGYTTDGVKYTEATTESAIGAADVSGLAARTMPSIVAITCTEEGQNYYDLFGQYYQGQETSSAGSGFIIGKNDTELLIATNNHVVEGAKTISIQFIDDEVYEATAKGMDASSDLAVVAVKLADIKSSTMKEIKIASLGDSSEVKVGERVMAIGNALGYGQSVTVGYISATNREITESSGNEGEYTQDAGNKITVIQTDAAINPGNSGGALINMNGEVIGINSAKIASSSVEGIGYAIPISDATPIIDELMNKEVLTEDQKGYLGISGKSVTKEASAFDMPTGVYVAEVAKDGAAAEAGIQKGDIITKINDVTVTTIESLKEKANSYKKGTKVSITLQRSENGEYQEKTIEVTLQGQDTLNSLQDATPTPDTEKNGNTY